MGRLTGRPSYSRRGGRSRPLTGTALGRKYRGGYIAESSLRAGPMPAPVAIQEAAARASAQPAAPTPAVPWFFWPFIALSYLATPVALWRLMTNLKPGSS